MPKPLWETQSAVKATMRVSAADAPTVAHETVILNPKLIKGALPYEISPFPVPQSPLPISRAIAKHPLCPLPVTDSRQRPFPNLRRTPSIRSIQSVSLLISGCQLFSILDFSLPPFFFVLFVTVLLTKHLRFIIQSRLH